MEALVHVQDTDTAIGDTMTGATFSLDGIEAVFLDLDGTLYLGSELIDGALDFLVRLEERGI